jgi:hypothetical protein
MLNKLASTNYKITEIFYDIVSIYYYREKKVRMTMKYKVVAVGDLKEFLVKPMANSIKVGVDKFVMCYEENPAALTRISGFDSLRQLLKEKDTPETYRLYHTLYMLQCLHLLFNKEGKSVLVDKYNKFIAERQFNNEQYFGYDQFLVLSTIVHETIFDDKEFKYMELLVATHDLGCIGGDVRHFGRSGEMSKSVFKELGYNEVQAEMARVINGNHTLLGEILLGEGAPEHAINLYEKLAGLSIQMGKSPDYGWHLLFILTALDIHAAYSGRLTYKKYAELHELRGLNELKLKNENWINERKKLLLLPDAEFVPEFKYLHMQYCANRLNQLRTADPAAAVWLLNKLSNLLGFLNVMKKGLNLDSLQIIITFKSGLGHCDEMMRNISKGDGIITFNTDRTRDKDEDGKTILFEGTFCGLPFTFTADGYVLIDDVVKITK